MFIVLSDALFAVVSAFAIIYALSFSFYCIFISNDSSPFSFERFIHEMRKFKYEGKR